jgi:hypothetical protein
MSSLAVLLVLAQIVMAGIGSLMQITSFLQVIQQLQQLKTKTLHCHPQFLT